MLKGEYEDYTWGYRQNPLDYTPSVEFQLHLVLLIPHLAIAKTILIRDPLFLIFLCVWKINFKTTIKTKTTHYFDTFSHSLS